MELRTQLKNKLKTSLSNDYGMENLDEVRFSSNYYKPKGFKNRAKIKLKDFLMTFFKNLTTRRYLKIIEKNISELEKTYNLLDGDSKELFIEIIAFRLLGYKKVKINGQARDYKKIFESVDLELKSDVEIHPGFLDFSLKHFYLQSIGYDLEIFLSKSIVLVDFVLEQYAFRKGNDYVVVAEPDDVVLDIGGCWGDTALYFAEKVGGNGFVYSFEFIPNNIAIHKKNADLNPKLKSRIELVPFPVSDKSDLTIYFKDNGPASQISLKPLSTLPSVTTTISIDDFVERYNVQKVDFIKMDIEGAEMQVLRGALKSIEKFRPKLAIAIYHSWDDMGKIPVFLNELNMNYHFFLGHYTMHSEETILFGKPI